MPRMRQWIFGCWAFLTLVCAAGRVDAVPGCPFCAPSDPPFSDRLARCDVALEVKWLSLDSDEKLGKESTTFEVVAVFRSSKLKFQMKDKVTWNYGRNGKPSDSFLLIGIEGKKSGVWQTFIALACVMVFNAVAGIF